VKAFLSSHVASVLLNIAVTIRSLAPIEIWAKDNSKAKSRHTLPSSPAVRNQSWALEAMMR
jgi:hypothetical protein